MFFDLEISGKRPQVRLGRIARIGQIASNGLIAFTVSAAFGLLTRVLAMELPKPLSLGFGISIPYDVIVMHHMMRVSHMPYDADQWTQLYEFLYKTN
ncbi:hypothetical protein SFRURICE_019017 [Spodoptera frugiperda]|uniref:SFRICE_023652 n=1 Tax=Spodoptera frugiperda TaxID=7108 RepID=A0A2H1W0Q9_SPOFR|nr:hypothetical protein SFRURICE_019017 [Spodoptera frugiperda]